jgi:hypothetical protein
VSVADGSAVELRVARPDRVPRERRRRPPASGRGTLLLLHGLGGDADSPYVRRTALHALERGWTVARMNLRNCGGTERLARTLYNAGQSGDVGAALADLIAAGCPRPLCAVGFSLGGAMVLRHAGEAGERTPLDALAAVNPPIELEACVAALERPSNALYHRRFLRGLCKQVDAVRATREVPGPPAHARRIGSLRRFDELFTAPDGGYASAADYYERASAAPLLPRLTRPTLVLSAANDPFVPVETLERHCAHAPAHVRFDCPARGGHVGYFQRGRPRFWAAGVVLGFLEREAHPPLRSSSGRSS